MNCTKLDDYLATQDDPRCEALPTELQQHLHGCAVCRADWQAYQTLDQSIAAWKSQTPSSLDAARLTTALMQAEIRPVAIHSRRSFILPVATVAAAVLALLLWRGNERLPENPQTQIVSAPPAAEQPDAEIGPTVAELWADVRASSEEWATVPTVRALPAWPALPLLTEISSVEGDAAPVSALDAAPRDVWANVSRPVTDQVGEAFRFLRVAWPEAAGAPRG